MASKITILLEDEPKDISAVQIKKDLVDTLGLDATSVTVSKLTKRQYDTLMGVYNAKPSLS